MDRDSEWDRERDNGIELDREWDRDSQFSYTFWQSIF
jgi:hypothetical protein